MMSDNNPRNLAWPQLTRTGYVTGVYWFLGTGKSQAVGKSAAFMSHLRSLSLTHCCELCINTQVNKDGRVEHIVLTTLPVELVSASAASYSRNCPDFTVTVKIAKPPAATPTSAATGTRSNLRVQHGN
jgi:hypothetical protein